MKTRAMPIYAAMLTINTLQEARAQNAVNLNRSTYNLVCDALVLGRNWFKPHSINSLCLLCPLWLAHVGLYDFA
jgi:hypothetical protein